MNLLALPPAVLTVFGLFALVVAVALGYMLRREYTMLRARGKGRAWWVVRLGTVPVLGLCAALVLVPARATSGMEGLAVFYLLLFTLAPLVWFGLHWLLGQVARPRLSGRESLVLGLSVPVFVVAVALLGHWVQSLAFSLHRQLNQPPAVASADEGQPMQAHHTHLYTRRYSTAGGDFFVSRWHSPVALRLERVDWVLQGHDIQHVDRQRPLNICRDGHDLVMLEAADRPPSALRIYWRTEGSALYRSELPPRDGTVVARPLVPSWSDARVTLPETFPRPSVVVGRLLANGKPDYARDEAALEAPPGAFHCWPVELQTPFVAAGMYLMVSRQNGEVMTAMFQRPPLQTPP